MLAKIWARAALALALGTAALGACSGNDEPGAAAAPDAGAAPQNAVLGLTATLASADEALATRLAPRASGGLHATPDGLASPAWREPPAEPRYEIGALVPRTASGALLVGIGKSPAARLEVRLTGAASSPVVLDAGRAAFAGVYRATDVVVAASRSALEWAYVLNDASAPTSFAADVKLPPGLPFARDTAQGGIEFLDEGGAVRLTMPRPFALDARGERRDVEMTWTAGRVELALDTSGLTFPVLLDPAIETPVWEQKIAPPDPRSNPGMAYDAARQRVVLFGGKLNSKMLGDTWEWDGTTWTLRSLIGPSARYGASVVYDSTAQRVRLFGGFGGGYLNDTWEWDGTTWTALCTTAPCSTTLPPARHRAMSAYDPARQRFVVFGGSAGVTYFQDVWEFTGTAWQERCTSAGCSAGRPSARSDGGMFYDTVQAYTVLFGGYNGSTANGETWRWNGTNWAQLSPATPPSARYNFSLSWYGAGNRGVLFGGQPASSETWEWNGATTSWTQLSPLAPQPALTDSAVSVYVASSGKTLLFGTNSSDAWFWDGTRWAEQTAYPAPRYDHALAYDSERSRTVLFGGNLGTSSLNDTWEWNGLVWKRTCTSCGTLPTARYGTALAYDPLRSRTVLFGGTSGNQETWEYDGTAWTQQCTTAPCTTARPTGRSLHALAADEARGVVFLFGGLSGGVPRNDSWTWNGTSWVEVCATAPCTTTRPAARQRPALAYARDRNVVVLFGGSNAASTYYGDTWEWNGTAWSLRSSSGPAAREGATLAYDPARKRVVLYGGQTASTTYSGETWEWNGTAWTEQVAASAPDARRGAAAFDESRRRFVEFGGIGRPGNGNAVWGDTWEYFNRGGACGAANACDTGYCTDGVCCEDFVCGTCQACNTAAAPGVCAPVTNAQDSDTCTGLSTCSGTGVCLSSTGQTCATGATCASGFCSDGYCCSASCSGGCDACSVAEGASANGTCTLSAAGSNSGHCGGMLCQGAGDCPSTCDSDTDCASGYYCGDDALCHQRRAKGNSCNLATDCFVAGCRECVGSTNCVDGVCCDLTCTGACRSCNLGGLVGTCSDVTSGEDSDTCFGTQTCTSSATCKLKNGQTCTAGSSCASGNCVDGYCCDKNCTLGCNTCNQVGFEGTCLPVAGGDPGANPSCSPYLCDGVAGGCPTSCTSDASCASGSYCAADNTCRAQKAQGAACNTAAGADCEAAGCRACGSAGGCIDGYCCNTTCGSACDACNGAALSWSGATNGTCASAPAGYSGSPACGAYACPGGSATCGTACTSDVQCSTGYYCAKGGGTGTCQLQKATGTTCNLTTDCQTAGCRECASNNCVDGFCCNSSCPGACESCGLTPGTCTPTSSGTAGSPACSSGYLCNGTSGSCPSACTSNAQCDASAYFCNTSTSLCEAKGANGAACTAGSQCTSGNCVDGVCCNSNCNGLCKACSASKKGSGANGACGDIGAGTDPDAECGDDGSSSCQKNGSCNGAGACQLYSSGTPCGATTCTGSTQTGYSCNGTGTCQSGVSACTPYVCGTSACKTACTGDADCLAAFYCQTATGTCLADQATGATCTAASQCTSGNCVDGFCCDTACTGTCQACSASKKGSGTSGTCGSIAAATDPDNECAAQATTTCGTTGLCSGGASCALHPNNTACGTATCVDADTQQNYKCDGFGVCGVGTTTECGTYVCGATGSCRSTCSADADCVPTAWCRTSDGTCLADQAKGAACTSNTQCSTGNCVDGFCCDAPCAGSCRACSLAKTGVANGTCSNITAGLDPDNECAAEATTTCGQNGSCNGSGVCAKWPFGTVCGTTTCSAGLQTGQSCDGSGACVSGTSSQCTPYVCGSSSCKTNCTSDSDCVGTYFCRISDGTCQPDLPLGASCSAASQCQAPGYCADGVCCDAACSTTCRACTAAKKGSGIDGECGAIKVATDPDNECAAQAPSTCGTTGSCSGTGSCQVQSIGTVCGTTSCLADGFTQQNGQCDGFGGCVTGSTTPCAPYACGPSACKTTCASNTDCAATHFCQTTTSTCQPDKANGGTCTAAAQCVSGSCVDGVCCDSPCAGSCQACTASKKGSGQDGACGNVASATDPDNECAAEASTSCGLNGQCNGSGACGRWAFGTICGATACSNGLQTGQACDGGGNCVSGSSTACAPFTCGATSCRSTCTSDGDCVGTYYCRVSDGTCQPDLAVGAACTGPGQCSSGFCADGYCCDAGCSGACEACSASKKGGGSNGTCGKVADGSDPDDECAPDAPSTCGKNGFCNGAGACKLWSPGTTCGASTCGNGLQSGFACDGFGTCSAGSTTPCAPYACSGSACATACTDDSSCIGSYYCRTSDGTCQPDLAPGATCTGTGQCATGYCVDGVCCDGPCTGTCQACTASKKGGGASGVCGNVVVDTDPDNECATDSPTTCRQNGLCDGSGGCRKYPPGTNCGQNTCASGSVNGYQCDGFGTCLSGATTSCAPYQCADATSCASSCASDTQCVPTAFCDSGTGSCKGDQTNGVACSADVQCISGHCVDGVCCDTACGSACQACSAARKGSGSDGVCGDVGLGLDPDGDCTDDGTTSCGKNGACDGNGTCQLYAAGTVCGATTCATGTQTGYACNGLGACQPGLTTSCAPYACQGNVCGALCVSDGECVASHYCRVSDGTCQPDQAAGAACGSDAQCSSAHCVDGVCCDSPCTGPCQACSAARRGSGVDGQCGSVAAGTDPDGDCVDEGVASCHQDGLCTGTGSCRLYAQGTACGATTCTGGTQSGQSCDGLGTCQAASTAGCAPFVCQGSACGVSCAGDVDCVAAAYCAPDSTCKPDQAAGAACGAGSQCLSGNCVDGVCCDQVCAGTCKACSAAAKGGGVDGVCGNVARDLDPDSDCAAQSPDTCQSDGACDGAGACKLWALGTSCGVNTCNGATQTGKQCNGFGVCVDGATASCAPFLCLGTACATSCGTDQDCVNTAYCGGGACQPKAGNGQACTADNQCQSAFCVEGVCCDTRCDGICQACTAANKDSGADGVCSFAKVGVDPHGNCDAEDASTCGNDGTCDGQGSCARYAAGVACGATSCVGNVQTGFACTGLGVCNPNATTDCGDYACNAGACRQACAVDQDCADTAFCEAVSGVCTPKAASGGACTTAATCQSGYCVDGVCCDTACSGQCEACDLGTALGKCSPVLGAPHGARAPCEGAAGTSPDELCAARTCDGTKSTATCQGYVGSEVGCRDATCTAGYESFSATCDGHGTCGEGDAGVQKRKCAPYACDVSACKESCTSDADCDAASGNRCDTASGQCVSSTTCDGDHTLTASNGETTDCAPFKCTAEGTCVDRCDSTAECVAPAVCNADRVCVVPAKGEPAQDSGCGCRAAPRASPRSVLLLFGLVPLLRRRRVRASSSGAAR